MWSCIILYKCSNTSPSLLKIPHWVPSSVISTCSFKAASLWQHIFLISSTNTSLFLYLFFLCLLLWIHVKTPYHWSLKTLYVVLWNFITFLSLQESKRSVMPFKNFRIQKLFHGTIRSLSYWNSSILPLKFNKCWCLCVNFVWFTPTSICCLDDLHYFCQARG